MRKPAHNPVIVAESQLHLSSGLWVRNAVKPAIIIAIPDIPYLIHVSYASIIVNILEIWKRKLTIILNPRDKAM